MLQEISSSGVEKRKKMLRKCEENFYPEIDFHEYQTEKTAAPCPALPTLMLGPWKRFEDVINVPQTNTGLDSDQSEVSVQVT